MNVFLAFSITFGPACKRHNFSSRFMFFSIAVNTFSEIFYGQFLNVIFNVVNLFVFVDSNNFIIDESWPSPVIKSYPKISSLSNPCKYLLFVKASIVDAEICAKLSSSYWRLDTAIDWSILVSSNSIFLKPPIFREVNCKILLLEMKAKRFPSILVHPTSNYLREEQFPEIK